MEKIIIGALLLLAILFYISFSGGLLKNRYRVYALSRTRFLGLRIVLRKLLARVFILFISAFAAGMVSVFLFSPFGSNMSGDILFLFLWFVVIYAVSLPYFQKTLYPFLLSFLSPKEFIAEERLGEMHWWGNMTQIPTMQEAYQQIISDIASYIDLENPQTDVSICLYDFKEKKFYLVFPRLDYKRIYISTDSLISYEMEKTAQKILVTDELEYLSGKNVFYASRYKKIIEELRALKTEVFIPLANGPALGSYVGLILLGKKKGGKPYTENEIEYLRKLSENIKIKLMHTMMYVSAEEMRKKALGEGEPPGPAEIEWKKREQERWIKIKKNATRCLIGLLVGFTAWWLWLMVLGSYGSGPMLAFANSYAILTIFGAIYGFLLARGVGGWKNPFGKALNVLSLGFFGQTVGQYIWAYYVIILNIDMPYPSLADVGFFGSVLFYLFGVWFLMKALHIKLKKEIFAKNWFVFLIPLCLAFISYILFFEKYQFDFSYPLTSLLDFGYPIGEIIYVFLASMVGIMLLRGKTNEISCGSISLFVFALIAQYVADFNFVYQASNGTWYNGGYGDYIYLLAYFLMTYAFIQFGAMYKIGGYQIKKSYEKIS